MEFKNLLKAVSQSTWFLALVLFLIFFAVTGYYYGWDDQHLEIPLLKHLIDHSLYAGDYYVESLRQNFPSFFYPALARLITVDQIPGVYFVLFILSRYFLFFWCFKLWHFLSESKLKAFACVAAFILVLRVEEFLYRTFSHQEFALPFIIAAVYYFFKERFLISAFLFGLAANLHALYSAFPMFFMCVYLLVSIKKHSLKTLCLSVLIFCVSALPFIIRILQNRFGADQLIPPEGLAVNWLDLYITGCPQNFFYPEHPLIPFGALLENLKLFYYLNRVYIYLVALFLVNLIFNRSFRQNKKAVVFCLAGFFLLLCCALFTYVKPSRLALDLNLIRTTQYLFFILGGFTVIFLISTIEKSSFVTAFALGICFVLLKFQYTIATLGLILIAGAILLGEIGEKDKSKIRWGAVVALTSGVIYVCLLIYQNFTTFPYSVLNRVSLLAIFAGLVANYFFLGFRQTTYKSLFYKRFFILIPLLIFFLQYSYYHRQKVHFQQTEEGFWKLQRNFEDMQRYVKLHTPQNATILIPYDMEMGGFRIQSEREVVVCYRDVGIIGFDYSAAVEWFKRIKDIENFKVSISQPLFQAIKNAITDYQASYIVFMRYAAPSEDNPILERVYTNESFVLFQVNAGRQ